MSAIEIFNRAEKVRLPDFGAHFETFRTRAFRLEVLPSFKVESEAEPLDAFRNGGAMPVDFNADWHNILRAARTRGARIERLRLLPRTPNDYLRFEINWGYAPSATHGESVRFAFDDDLPETVRTLPFVMDTWVFDSDAVFPMIYDRNGAFLGVVRLHASDRSAFIRLAEGNYTSLPGLEEIASSYAPRTAHHR